jgi:ribosomal protein S21
MDNITQERKTMEVKIRKNEPPENLIKRFLRKIKKSKIIDEVMDRKYYKKPSERRREKEARRLAVIEKQKKKEKQERGH